MSRLDVADGLPTVGGQVTLVCPLLAGQRRWQSDPQPTLLLTQSCHSYLSLVAGERPG